MGIFTSFLILFFISSLIDFYSCSDTSTTDFGNSSLHSKISALHAIDLQTDVSIVYVWLNPRRKMKFSKHNFIKQLYYSPFLDQFFPKDNKDTDYSNYLQGIDIDLNSQMGVLPVQHTVSELITYNTINDTRFSITQKTIFTSISNTESIFSIYDFIDPNNTTSQTIDYDKLELFLANKNHVKSNPNTLFVVISQMFQSNSTQSTLNLTHKIVNKHNNITQTNNTSEHYQKNLSHFMYCTVSEGFFQSNSENFNSIIAESYMIHQQKQQLQPTEFEITQKKALISYMWIVDQIYSQIQTELETGVYLLNPETMLSEILELDQYFEFSSMWKYVNDCLQESLDFYMATQFKASVVIAQSCLQSINKQLVPFLKNTLQPSVITQRPNFLIGFLQDYTFTLIISVIIVSFAAIYIKKSGIFSLIDKKFV